MGRPKAWLPFGDELLLPRVARLLAQTVTPVVGVAAAGQELPPLPAELEVARDDERERGPLQGLAAGLAALAGRADAAFVTSCDVPFLRPAFVRRMIDLLGSHMICVPDVDGYRHTLAAVYRLEVLAVVQALLHENRLRTGGILDAVPTRVVRREELMDVDPTLESLRNVNTPEDYAAALRDLA